MSGISFSKEGLANATKSFDELQGKIKTEITTVLKTLETIDSNWSGPEHDSAKSDKDKSQTCLNQANQTIDNMNGALVELSSNASKVSYNG